MSVIGDEYRRSWARRYIREAQADLSTAEENPISTVSINFALISMRKSQTAIYYSLGDPEYLASIVGKSIENEKMIKDATMRLLIQMETLIQRDNTLAERLDRKSLIEESRILLEIDSKIVNLVVGPERRQSA